MSRTHFYSSAELAHRWQRSVDWVAEQAALGKVPGIKIGGRWRFDPADIDRYELGRKTGYQIELTPGAQRNREKAKR